MNNMEMRLQERVVTGFVARASIRFATIIKDSHIDFSEIYLAIWAMGWGSLTTLVPSNVYEASAFYAVLNGYAPPIVWGAPMIALGMFHVFAALGEHETSRRWAAGLSLAVWGWLGIVHAIAGWPVVAFTYHLGALAAGWCYVRLAIEHARVDGGDG